MFKTELTCEEESLLIQLLDGIKLSRIALLQNINSTCQNSTDKDGIEVAKSLFEKVQGTSDYEYNEYVDLILN